MDNKVTEYLKKRIANCNYVFKDMEKMMSHNMNSAIHHLKKEQAGMIT